MTSREALDWLKKQNKKQNNGNGDLWLEMYINAIEKDLEVLEILKQNLYVEKGTGRFKGIEIIECSLGNQHSGDDYIKVKEFLQK